MSRKYTYRSIDLSIFSKSISDDRDVRLKYLVEYSNYKDVIIDNYVVNLIESVGYNSSMKKFSDLISDEIFDRVSNRKYDNLNFSLIIKQLGILQVNVVFDNSESISIIKDSDIIKIEFGFRYLNIDEIKVKMDHELHHIFINQMGNKTNKNYFIINDLIPKYDGKTNAFLVLYYLSFPDEISCNVQMIFREIVNKNIKTKEEFLKYLKDSELYNISNKMIDFDIFSYWTKIVEEGNDRNLISNLDIKNLNVFLNKTSFLIKKAGKEYKRRLSRAFI